MKKTRAAFSHLGFHDVSPTLLWLSLLCSLVHKMRIGGPGSSFLRHYQLWKKNKEIKALTFTTKHGSWSGSKNNNGKKNKRKNCLIRALGKKWLTPMHTPAFCQADRRHDNHFFSPNTQWAMLVEMFVWKDRASRRWDRSNRRATIFGTVNCCLQKYLKK